MRDTTTIYEKRKYKIKNVSEAKQISTFWLEKVGLKETMDFGLPEADDRYHVWRVPLKSKIKRLHVGEIVIDAYSSLIDEGKTTKPEILKERVVNGYKPVDTVNKRQSLNYRPSTQRNTIALGDAEVVLQKMASQSVDLIFTSPPYYNARPEYSDYITYEEYLLKIRKVIQNCHRVLNEGRFFVMNISPVLIRRTNRNEASKRIAVPFDIHRVFTEEGFDFIDDIIWEKPEGAGWATSRGRRFAADRNPLQYKPVPITEYILVYRKHTDRLIDWNIRTYPDQNIVKSSKIVDQYNKTNIWKIKPSHDKNHPAIFPSELAEKVIKYYSFETDVVLDPFAGIGTVGKAAIKLGRRFVLIEINPRYVAIIKIEVKKWLGKKSNNVLYLNCKDETTGQDFLF